MWITPKTNWTKDDTFDISPDYERIKGNILHLKAEAAQLYLPFSINNMSDYSIKSLPYEEFFNNVENGLKAIYDNTFKRNSYTSKTFIANATVWDWRDLNRIEGVTAQIYVDFMAQSLAKPKLKFMLGGVTL
ncbi:MAG: hypothetical protein RR424_10345 [Oscillospiraceae bacterium]